MKKKVMDRRLATRIAAYEETLRDKSATGKYHKPGSNKKH